jgi:flavin reductase (DIM6/NTAB) family NADH-FMN oxidoreductase RutF
MKKNVELTDYLGKIYTELKNGVLLTTASGDEVNTMTIAWGAVGVEWAKPIFTAYVRTGRHTHKLLAENPEFTINIPLDERPAKAIAYCGTNSGRDVDKIKEMGLTLVPGDKVSVPAIKELPLTIECKVLYKQLQDKQAIGEEIQTAFYPADKGSEACGGNCDYHTMFYGEIVAVYIQE